MNIARNLPSGLKRPALRALQRANEALGSERFTRPSLHGIEAKLDRLFEGRPGFFVEAGAFDGFDQSNTYWLERFRGWRGVLIEAIPEQASACRRRRKASTTVQCALVAPGQEGPVTMRYAGLMSIAQGARGSSEADDRHVSAGIRVQNGLETYDVEVPGRTLADVLEDAGAPSTFDLLSLDVEGLEGDVLAGLGRFVPRFVMVEMNDPDVPDQLEGLGYRLVDGSFTPNDALYELRG